MTNNKTQSPALLWTVTIAAAIALLFARAVYPEYLSLTIISGLVLLGALGALIQKNRTALKTRSAAFGFNSIVTTVLVISIIGVLNFLVSRYPGKLDLTKNKVHTLSDQTTKVVKGLSAPVKAVLFGKLQQKEQLRPLLENLQGLNPKFEIEYVDPDKEPSRVKTVGIRANGTLQLITGTRDVKIDAANEEKITNALIKLLKDKVITVCNITGHGEKDFNSNQADGYDQVKKALISQSYEVKDLNLIQEGKIPETCQMITIVGSGKAFFPAETKIISDYLASGGRALVAVDLGLSKENGAGKGEHSPELMAILGSWNIKVSHALIIDPVSRMLQLEPTVPVIATYSKDSPITKDFQGNSVFPLSRPLEIMADAPASLKLQWIGQSTPNSWGETNFDSLIKGQVKFDPEDFKGPLKVALTAEGKLKDSKATKNTRLAVFGTSAFATNQFARFGNNLDFFLNSVSWLVEDESLISIRTKEEGAGKIELSQKQGTVIFLVTVLMIPLLISIGGTVIWAVRRKL